MRRTARRGRALVVAAPMVAALVAAVLAPTPAQALAGCADDPSGDVVAGPSPAVPAATADLT